MRSERWAKPSEIKRILHSDTDKSYAGPVLFCKNGRHWKYTLEGHSIFLGVSGAGKSRRGTIPMIRSFIEAEESYVVVDPKGEINSATAPYLSRRYNTHVIDFRNIFASECVNVLAAPAELYKTDDPVKKQVALEMIDDLAHTLYTVRGKADPFWPESARSVFIGVVYALLEYAGLDEINMASVYQFIAKGEERNGLNTFLKDFLSLIPTSSISSLLLQSYANTANDTRAGIRSVFLEGLSMFARSEGLISMTSSDDLHINQLDGETPTAIYIILPDESPIYDSICTVLIGQLMGHYIRLAQDRYNGRLPRRVNFLVEEAGNVGRIGSLGHLMSAGRSRNVRCQLVLQNYSQLDTLYGTAEASTIRSNADVLISFRTNHWDTLAELSRKCGERTVENNGHLAQEPLITPSQLAAMQTGQALVMISGATKFISWIPDYTEIFDCSKPAPPRRQPVCRRKATSTFDLKEFVKYHKRQNTISSIQSSPVYVNPFTPPGADPGGTGASSGSHLESDFASLFTDLDAGIDCLKTKQESERKNQPAPFSFVLLGFGGSGSEVVQAIRDNTEITSYREAFKVLGSLPHVFRFTTKAACEKAKSAIKRAGGIIDAS